MNIGKWSEHIHCVFGRFKHKLNVSAGKHIIHKLDENVVNAYNFLKNNNYIFKIKYNTAKAQEKNIYHQDPMIRKIAAVSVFALLCYGSIFVVEKAEAYRIANTPTAAVEVRFKGQKVGVVATTEHLEQALSEMETQIEEYYNMDAVADDDISFVPAAVKPSFIESEQTVLNSIKDNIHFKVKAAAIVVNGKQTVIVRDAAEAQSVLNRIMQPYLDKAKSNPNIKEVRIADDVKIVEQLAEYNQVKNADEAYEIIKQGGQDSKVYEVKDGDTIWAIVKRYKLSLEDIQKANPNMASLDDLQIGDKINLTVPKQLISVETVERVQYTEDIPYETVYKENSSMYKNQTEVVQTGSNGQRQVTAEVVKLNGVEARRTIIAQNVIKQKKDQIIAKGTKAVPSYIGTGVLALPARGRITSSFGYRGSEFHTGVDIGVPIGTPVHAADNGRVIFAGWDGNYGKLVKIDHNNGIVTYYAHNSKIAVKVGQVVAKGQVISYSGSTGRSTGPHLHFEVRKNGTPINPLR